MSTKPIFVATHPRACSTAFERVFMTRRDILTCVHEPFGDAFYFGPERLSIRYEDDEKAREESGFADSTFKTIFERIEREGKEYPPLFSPYNDTEFLLDINLPQEAVDCPDTHSLQGKRLFIKDITHYLVPPEGKPATIAPSLGGKTIKKGVGTAAETNGNTNGVMNGQANGHANGISNGVIKTPTNGAINGATTGTTNGTHNAPYPYDTTAEPGNPTVVPAEILKQFHFTFLIRHPRHSIPSYYRCTIPPLDKVTGFYNFMPAEAGYDELRRVFDFLRNEKQVGPALAGEHGQLPAGEVSITVIDADDLLDDPEGIISAYCKEVGIEYDPQMLIWDTEEDHARAREAFEKWRGFHDDAINSTSLKPRAHRILRRFGWIITDLCLAKKKKAKAIENEDQEWIEKYGKEAQKVIRECVNANISDYEYLKSFAIKV
ncbi:P-loop containing nucleoside triphosphate hydrolase protein [Halenospora varia]|nr:P-loop containing nucleoside triphosphate hydrolase protein [Halenospora varia]